MELKKRNKTLFAVSAPGLELITAQELGNLGLLELENSKIKPDYQGGIVFYGDLLTIYQANLFLRTASRILVRLGSFHAVAFSELRAKATHLQWEEYLTPGLTISIRATCHKSRLYHSGAVAERVAAAIGDHFGKQPKVMKFDEQSTHPAQQLIIVRLFRDSCTISIDTSGALLHRRGYRLATAKAPLRETTAAGMLLAAQWDPAAPLLDPFCGSGTIPIEAALIACGLPPGRSRSFGFMNWPNYDPDQWDQLQAKVYQEPSPSPQIWASDRDAGAIEIARANAQRAGVESYIEFSHRAISAIEPTGKGWVVSNPPYGKRISEGKDLRNLYAQLGKTLRTKCPGWQLALLSSDPRLLGHTGLHLGTDLSFDNGGIRVRLGQGIVPSSG